MPFGGGGSNTQRASEVLCDLKVPKCENFSLAFFALSEPIWVCELGTGEKNRIFLLIDP